MSKISAVNRLFLALCLLCAPLSSRAQEAAPAVQIVDVLPTVDPYSPPENPLISFDLLLGLTPRPVWWGQNYGDHVASVAGEFAASVVARTDAQLVPLSLLYSRSYTPVWNEALGLYTVHVHAPLKGTSWPRGAEVRFRGDLPPFFVGQTQGVPFEVVLPAPTKNQRRDVQLVAPFPSLWVKAVRVFRVTKPIPAIQTPGMNCFVAITFPLRDLRRRGEVTNSLTIVDVAGDEVRPQGGGTWGSAGTSLDSSTDSGLSASNFTLEHAPFGFVTRYAMWGDSIAGAAPDLWARQTFTFNNGAPLVLTVPVQRGGKLLEGDIPSRDWKIETPKPN